MPYVVPITCVIMTGADADATAELDKSSAALAVD